MSNQGESLANLRDKAGQGLQWLGATAVIAGALSVIQTGILGRFFLGPEEYGLMGLVLIFMSLAIMIADMGFSAAIVYHRDASQEQLSSVYWFNLFASTTLCILIYIASPLMAYSVAEPRIIPMIQVMALIVLLDASAKPFQMMFERDLQFAVVGASEIAANIFATLFAIFTAWLGAGAWALVFAHLSRAILRNGIFLFYGLKNYPIQFRFKRKDLDGFLGFGMYQLGERFVGALSGQVVFFVIGRWLGAASLGLFTVATMLASMPMSQIAGKVSRVAFPLLSKIRDDRERLKTAYLQHAGLLVAVISPALFGLFAIAPVAVPLLLGEKWLDLTPIMQILCLSYIFQTTAFPYASLLLAVGRADWGFRWNLFWLVVHTINALLITFFTESLVAIAASIMTLNIVFFFVIYKTMVKPIIGECLMPYIKKVAAPILCAGTMALAVLAIQHSGMIENQWILLVVQLLVGGITYAVLMFVFLKGLLAEMISLMPKKLVPGRLRTAIVGN